MLWRQGYLKVARQTVAAATGYYAEYRLATMLLFCLVVRLLCILECGEACNDIVYAAVATNGYYCIILAAFNCLLSYLGAVVDTLSVGYLVVKK